MPDRLAEQRRRLEKSSVESIDNVPGDWLGTKAEED